MSVIISHLVEKSTQDKTIQPKVNCIVSKTGKIKEYTFNHILSELVEQCKCFAIDPRTDDAKELICEQLE